MSSVAFRVRTRLLTCVLTTCKGRIPVEVNGGFLRILGNVTKFTARDEDLVIDLADVRRLVLEMLLYALEHVFGLNY